MAEQDPSQENPNPEQKIVPASEFVNVDGRDMQREKETAGDVARYKAGEITLEELEANEQVRGLNAAADRKKARMAAGGKPGMREIVRRWLNG